MPNRLKVRKLDELCNKIPIYELQYDGVYLYTEFGDKIKHEGNYSHLFSRFVSRIIRYSNLQSFDKGKFRDITPKKEIYKEYEFKINPLRLYMCHLDKFGSIIFGGGHKNTQTEDIRKFRGIKKIVCEEFSQTQSLNIEV